ncbi:MAG: hypothetical protein R3D27_09070 [Hyphomicrobiaceae bacterium]
MSPIAGRRKWLKLTVVLTGFAPAALAHTTHTGQSYDKYKRPNGASCCSGHDCRPTRYEYDSKGALIMFPEGRRVVVPRHLLNRLPSDDSNAHWCGLIDSRGQPYTFCAILPMQAVERPATPPASPRRHARASTL